jgi:predicted enzyme related to lactoylglutathione lyase
MAAKKNPVNYFEIPVVDFKRAKAFYEGVFGVKLESMDYQGMKMASFPSSMKQYGISGSITKAKGYRPSRNGVVIYFVVSDIKATLAKIARRGGKTVFPKMSIGEWGFVAHFLDSEGNRLALHSMK